MEHILLILTGVVTTLLAQFIWHKYSRGEWEKEIPSGGNEYWKSVGYFIDPESNQWVHPTRGPLANITQSEADTVLTEISKGKRHVRTKWLKRKIFYYAGKPTRKVYFLEPNVKY